MSWWYHLSGGWCRPLPGGPYIPRVFEDPTCGGGASVNVAWDDIIGKPLEFPPEDHTHLWADITDRPDCFEPCDHTHLWADITDPPACYEPCAHTHPWSEITDTPETFPPDTHGHTWEEISGKPECFPPCEHTHEGLGPRERGLLCGGEVYNAVPHRVLAPPPDEDVVISDIGVESLDGGTP